MLGYLVDIAWHGLWTQQELYIHMLTHAQREREMFHLASSDTLTLCSHSDAALTTSNGKWTLAHRLA